MATPDNKPMPDCPFYTDAITRTTLPQQPEQTPGAAAEVVRNAEEQIKRASEMRGGARPKTDRAARGRR